MANDTDAELLALKDFADGDKSEIGEILEDIIGDVARTGQYIHPWNYLKHLYSYKIDKVTSSFLGSNPPLGEDGNKNEELTSKLEEFRKSLISMFDKFRCAPFTIQRISELLVNPSKHYKSSAKFLRGLEKNILVVSTVESVTPDQRPPKRPRSDTVPEKDQNGFSLNLGTNPPVKKYSSTESLNATSEQENKLEENKSSTTDMATKSEASKQDEASDSGTTSKDECKKDAESAESAKTSSSTTNPPGSSNEQAVVEMNLASDEVMGSDEQISAESKPGEEVADQIVPVQEKREEVVDKVSPTQTETSSNENTPAAVIEAKEEEQMEVDAPAEREGKDEAKEETEVKEEQLKKSVGQTEDVASKSTETPNDKKDVACDSEKEKEN